MPPLRTRNNQLVLWGFCSGYNQGLHLGEHWPRYFARDQQSDPNNGQMSREADMDFEVSVPFSQSGETG